MAVEHDTQGREILEKSLEDMDRFTVRIGYFPGAEHLRHHPITGAVLPGSTSTAYIASIQELGYKEKIPARPFFRPTAEEKGGDWNKLMAQLMLAASKGKVQFSKGLETVGLVVSRDIASHIDTVTEPPLAPFTLAARRARRKSAPSTKPLIDTGLMRDQLTFQVTDGTTGEAVTIGE